MTIKSFEKKKCGRCGSAYVYVRIDGTIICRACGYKTKKEVTKK